ncbi:MAG: C4-dicarboxylate ABC transporter permease [Betaproteobacteria bacterium RIFCSPLOWO2_12_FULL_66_14]|nr:MAG: C4-dicarboxylate ABC transporter permease [Betaproteobacteria bacterium RIFCSPLOWO2_12_FULL_66_14]
MAGWEIALWSVVAMLALIYLGMHISTTLALISVVCVWLLRDNFTVAANLLWISAAQTINQFLFGVIPLFVLMGLLVGAAGMGRDTYDIGQLLLRRIRGGLGMATVAANAIFASITGVSVASASIFSKLSVPEMQRYGYNKRFAVGTVAGSSVLGMLIPPSVLFIIYGVVAEQSIGDLFIAGIGPGLLLTAAYCLQILAMAHWFPASVISDPAAYHRASHVDRRMDTPELLAKSIPIVMLVALVLGGLYSGVFTPVEAGAAGAFAALVFALARRKLTWRTLWDVILETGAITATLMFLIVSASMYSRMLGMSGLPTEMGNFMQTMKVGLYELLAIYVVIVLILGTIIDSTSIMLIMVPLFLPLLKAFGVDLVWFGVITVVATEIGLLTPPFGLSVFVVHSTLARRDISLADIFLGALPFATTMLIVLLLVMAFPGIAMYLVALSH